MALDSALGAAATMLMDRATKQAVRTSYYLYSPSVAAAGVATALFGIGACIMIWQVIRYRAWIWFSMVVAVLMEFIGFAARTYSTLNVLHRPTYIIQYCLILLAPVVIAGAIYVAFGRLVLKVVPPEGRTLGLLWVPVRWLTPIFVFFDIAALLIQVTGALMLVNTPDTDPDYRKKITTGRDIATAGVTLQIVAFGIFCIVCIRFHITSLKYKKQQISGSSSDKFGVSSDTTGKTYKPRWWWLLYTIEGACLLVLVRSIFREVEFQELASGSFDGPIHTQEFWLYVFDVAPMWIVTVLFLNVTPGAYAPLALRMPKQYAPVLSAHGSESRVVTADPENAHSYNMQPYPQTQSYPQTELYPQANSTQHLTHHARP
jgi:hypothetical protein